MSGRLVLVGTPIGNMGDLSPRAISVLAEADVVACEDTRRTGNLLQLAGIASRPLMTVNDHTEESRIGEIIERIASGETVAVVTDAGMPGISDPGERLVRSVLDAGHAVETVPGPSAVVTGLVVSGLAAGRFCFEGFLPRKGAARTQRLSDLASEPRTVVLYEAPHRLARTLTDLAAALGGTRRCALTRELTKLHEEVWRGSLDAAVVRCGEVAPRGEYVVVVDGAPAPPPASDDDVAAAVQELVDGGTSTRDAAAAVAARLGVSRRRAYELATGRRP